TCRPVEEARKFLERYTGDTVRRIRSFATIRSAEPVEVIHGDARDTRLPLEPTGIITSPPYPGLIDYHEQHRYAYELLGLQDRREEEIGPAFRGQGREAVRAYLESMVAVFANARRQLPARAPVIIVVNDSKALYPDILERSGLLLEERLTRHVNRRTGRRAGEFFEDVLVCSTRRGALVEPARRRARASAMAGTAKPRCQAPGHGPVGHGRRRDQRFRAGGTCPGAWHRVM